MREPSQIYLIDVAKGTPEKLTKHLNGALDPAWSPDGKRIAFVVRENPEDTVADQSSEALISNVYIVDVASGALTQVTRLTAGRSETPVWSPDGNTLTFQVVIDGRMNVSIADVITGEIQPLETGSACCPAWMRK